MTGYEVELYETEHGTCPVADFIGQLPPEGQAKVGRAIDLLAEYGPGLGMPYVRKMTGTKDLWELRIPFAGDAYRVFWFPLDGDTLVLVHATRKKTRKTPRYEVQTAEKRVADFRRRREDR